MTMTSETYILSVSELNQLTASLLESEIGWIKLRGEISNCVTAQSGHCYFTLKDEHAQVKCALFRQNAARSTRIQNGDAVIVSGRVSLYCQRGDFQIIAQHVEKDGQGALAIAFEKQKKALQKAGLFDPKHKQSCPTLPKQIAIVTSPTAAALQDILRVLKERFPAIPLRLYPCMVQGKQASASIVRAIEAANTEANCDCMIISRGGGSLEDLWPFNETNVAQAVFDSEIPVISGVGHETDTTIIDLVADKRAATPSQAAELAVPDATDFIDRCHQQQQRLKRYWQSQQERRWTQCKHLNARLQSPQRQCQQEQQRLDYMSIALRRLCQQRLQQASTLIDKQQYRLLQQAQQNIGLQQNRIKACQTAMPIYQQYYLEKTQSSLQSLQHRLAAMNPKNILAKAYTQLCQIDGTIVQSVNQVDSGQSITARLIDGSITCNITEVIKDDA